jgi:hypothetical protein
MASTLTIERAIFGHEADGLPRSPSPALSKTSARVLDLDTKNSTVASTRTGSLRATQSQYDHDALSPRNDSGVIPIVAVDHGLQPLDGIHDTNRVQVVRAPGPSSGRGMSKSMKRRERTFFIAACFPLFLAGWNE